LSKVPKELPEAHPLIPSPAEQAQLLNPSSSLSGHSSPLPAQLGFAAIILALGFLLLGMLQSVIGAFVLGAVLAFVIAPWVDWMAGRGAPRSIAILIIFLALAGIAWGLVLIFIPVLGDEINKLQSQGPGIASSAQTELNSLRGGQMEVFGFQLDLTYLAAQATSRSREFLLGQFGNALSLGLAAVGTLFQLLLMLVVAFLIALDHDAVRKVGWRVAPVQYRADFEVLWRDVTKMTRSYLRGQIIIAVMIGLACGLVDQVIGVHFALALGVLAAITALVPYFGPFLGAAPAVVVALSQSSNQALAVAVAYLVISNVILNFVFPKVVGDAVNLPPLLVIIALFAGFGIGGILGMFVAVPVAATFRIIFDYVEPRLHGTQLIST
jgi:predicted PurR-regulated permease PerM